MNTKVLRALSVFALVLVAVLALAGIALAQDTGADGTGGGTVVAEGLNGPMGVLVDPNGDVWAVDSGLGGDEPVDVFSPEAGGVVSGTYGSTSRIVKISVADGSMTEVATVPGYGVPMAGASGGSRLALLDGALYVSVSDWDSQPGNDPPEGIATIMSVAEDGTTAIVHDDWAWEVENNVYGVVYHAHPYGLTPDPDGGVLWVADAGANAVYTLDPASGEVVVQAVMEPLPGVFPRPDYDGQMLTDPVPTAVAFKDGAPYVSLLSGAPFVPGSAKVLALGEDGAISDYATGLTMIIDMRTGPDGELYAVSFGMSGEQGFVPNSGSIIRVAEGDASEVVASGLSFPSSIDFDADGNAYVTLNAVGAPGSGLVVKLDGLTEAEGTPLGEIMAAMAPPPEAGATEAVTDTAALTETAATTETAAEGEAEATPEAAPAAEPGSLDIVDTAVAAGNFNTLASALVERGLAETLKGEGPFTVFAPDDGAFQALPLADRIGLYRDPEALTGVLLGHVVEGEYRAADLTDGMTLTSLQGTPLAITVDGDKVLVNGVEVTSPDVEASNGIIHVIAGVLLPAAEGAEAGPEAPPAEEAAATEVVTETAGAEATAAMTATEVVATEAVTETAGAEATEAVTGTVEAEAAPAEAAPAEAAPAETPAEPAPETLPTTGASTSNGAQTLAVTGLVLLALVATAYVTRRKTA